MKELIGNAMNQYIVAGDKAIVMTEFIFVTSEPVYKPDGGSGIVRTRETDQFRVNIQRSQLLELAKWFTEAAKSADDLAKRVTVESAGEQT